MRSIYLNRSSKDQKSSDVNIVHLSRAFLSKTWAIKMQLSLRTTVIFFFICE